MAKDDTTQRTLAQRLFQPVDIASLVFFRIAFGGIMLWEMARYGLPGDDGSSRVEAYYASEFFHFKYYGFEWVTSLPEPWMSWVPAVIALGAVMVVLGLMYRLGALIMCIGLTYLFLQDRTYYLNHFYLVCIVAGMLVFIPAHWQWSIDALLRPKLRSSTAPTWALWLIRFQLGIVYFYGGLAKINADWLFGEPMRAFLGSKHDYPVLGPFAFEEWLVMLLTWGGLLLDLFIVPALMWRPTRIVAYLFAVAFHLSNSFLFHIGIFPWLMIAATTIYFEPDWPRRVLQFLMLVPKGHADTSALPPALGPGRRIWLAVLGVYVVVQVLVPFRHFLYPGDASWTEQGHQFAWRMMLRNKLPQERFMLYVITDPKSDYEALVDPKDHIPEWETEGMFKNPVAREHFGKRIGERVGKSLGRSKIDITILHEPCKVTVVDKGTGLRERIPLAKHMTRYQMIKMAGRPDMMIQFAHYIADLKRAEGKDVAVYMEAWVTMNGREPQMMINPKVDLAQVEQSVGHGEWIVPLTNPLRRNNYREWFKRPDTSLPEPENDRSASDKTGQVD